MAATAVETVQAALAADVTLTALATGGVLGLHASGRAIVNETDTPGAYATDAGSGVKSLKPCLVLSVLNDPVIGPGDGVGRQEWLRVTALDASNYTTITAMLNRVHALLHTQYLQLSNGAWVHLTHVDTPAPQDLDTTVETGVGGQDGACMAYARYTAVTGWGAY